MGRVDAWSILTVMAMAVDDTLEATVLAKGKPVVESELVGQIERGQEFAAAVRQSPPRTDSELTAASARYWHPWRRMSEQILRESFSPPDDLLRLLKSLRPAHLAASVIEERAAALPDDILREVDYLQDLVGRLEVYSEHPSAGRAAGPGDIFLVHGRDTRARARVAKFLTTVTGTAPVVLAEQAESGRVVIEKLETEASKARFAVILMTGDDEGRLRGASKLVTRARQNVVLEAGWFMGKLGRQRIAVLVDPDVEHPSDISGMILIPFGSGTKWKSSLRRELRASGFLLTAQR